MISKDKWLIFDFDGTLADSFEMAHQVLNRLAVRYHYRPVGDDEVEMMRRKTATEFFAALGISLLKVPMVVIQARYELRQLISEISPIKGISDVLSMLQEQGYRMGILTSNATDNVDKFLKKHGRVDFWECVYCSHDIFGKAHHIKTLIRKHRLDPDAVVYIGDMNGDIEAAHRAGVKVAAVSWGYQAREVLEKHNPTWLFDSPSQLAEFQTLFPPGAGSSVDV